MKQVPFAAAILLLAGASHSGALTLARSGTSEYRIVTPASPGQEVVYAAGELQFFLELIAGVRLAVVSENELDGEPCVYIGPCKAAGEAGLVEAAAELGDDGVIIRTLGRNLALLGQNRRGHVYAVYVFLERFLDVRFLTDDCTVAPRRSEIDLPELDYSYAPPFMYRETLYFDSFPKRVAARQRLNGPTSKCDASTGGKIEIFPYVHSFDDLFPEQEYFQDHPEYYGLQGGKRVAGAVHAQLCLTNPEVLRLSTEKVFGWISEHPNVPIFDVSQNDGTGACECDACIAVVGEEGSQHGPILRFVNAIAEEVGRKHPDKWIETLAYAYSVVPPTKTRPRDNVIVRLCHAGCFFHGFEACNLGSDLAGWLAGWNRLTQRIFIWHYATNFAHYLAPNPNLEGLAADIRFYAAHGVNGLMVQCNYQGRGGELAELRQYLAAQLMWDPSRDPRQIRTEFCQGYYGAAATTVLEFLDLLDRRGREQVHAFAVWDPKDVAPPEFVAQALALLSQARTDAAGDHELETRIDLLTLPYWYVQLLHPATYGVTDQEAHDILAQARDVIQRRGIEYVREGGAPNAADWLAGMAVLYDTPDDDVVLNLLKTGLAEISNCADFRAASVTRDGVDLPTLFQHPDGSNDGDATYAVELPAGREAVLSFATVITNASNDGVRFAVLVDGSEVWSEAKTTYLPAADSASDHTAILPDADPFTEHVVDLSTYSGRTIRLTLRVNAQADNQYDWANWVQPQVRLKD